MNTPSNAEARELDDATLLDNLKWFAELCADNRKRNRFRHATLAAVLKAAHDRLATLPPQDSSGDARELVKRLVPLASAKRDFINELGREITAGVELGNGPDKYARLYLYGPDSGIDSYTTWVELAQIYSVLHEVFEAALASRSAPDGWVLVRREVLEKIANLEEGRFSSPTELVCDARQLARQALSGAKA